jgi:H+/gluconate symporter-like permease
MAKAMTRRTGRDYLIRIVASEPIPWMNDGGFWGVAMISGMTVRLTLRTMRPMMPLPGIAGLLLTALAAWVLPRQRWLR